MAVIQLSRHATARLRQRGVSEALIEALMEHADVEVHVGGGCTALRCSRGQLADPNVRLAVGPDCDRLGSLALVFSSLTGEVVTVLHDRGGPQGRRYRRAA